MAGELILQTPTAAEWAADLEMHRRELQADEGWVATTRADSFKTALEKVTKAIHPRQGDARERKFRLVFGDAEPRPAADEIPVWVRDGWSTTEKGVVDSARQAGTSSPWVFVFVDRAQSTELRNALIEAEAAHRTIDRRAAPTTPEGRDARAGMKSREGTNLETAASLVGEIIMKARVYQGGGAEIAEPSTDPTLSASLARAIDNAVLRMYPEFNPADSKGWSRVIDLARDGNPTPLSGVGHRAEARTHPVAKAILASLPPSGRQGQTVRKEFDAPPYGWPQDAIDGCLLALVTEGQVEARRNGSVVRARDIAQNVLGSVEFRPQSIVPTINDKLAVRSLAQDLGIRVQGQDDLELPPQILGRLHELVAAAGGTPPLPERPSAEPLWDLESQTGPALLVRMAAEAQSLKSLAKEWKDLAEAIPARQGEWQQAQQLLRQCGDTVAADEARGQLNAVNISRSLLANPNPLTPAVSVLSGLLRAALLDRWAAYATARSAGLAQLESAEVWHALPEEDRSAILRDVGLAANPDQQVGTTAELLAALEDVPLRDWEYRTQAVPTQVGQALTRAAARTEPETVELPRRRVLIRDTHDLDEYVKDLEREVLPHLAEHRSVIL